MKYITGQHALNIPCSLSTCGDWHQSAIHWEIPYFRESEDSVFKDYGIELNKKIPEHIEKYNVANHIRAILDLLEMGNFSLAQGMNKDFICNDEYTEEIFEQVMKLKHSPDWDKIDMFMGKEYFSEWLDYKKGSDLKSAVSINDCKLEHRKIINSFLEYLNNSSNSYILKGGAALFICYKSDRFSENIKLDSNKSNIKNIVDAYCKNNNYSYCTSKETDSIKKYMINYGNYNNPLEIELSLKNREINDSEVSTIDGIKVYNIDTLCIMKAIAYVYREQIRDLYDLTFIVNNYFENLDQQTINIVQKNIEYNGIERLDYLIKSQNDEIINKKKLVVDFVAMSDKLGLLYSNKEREIISSYNIILGR